MAWFYYTGSTPAAIYIGDGNSVAVRPHTYVEVPNSAASNSSIQRLMGMGVLRQTGMPEHAREAEREARSKAEAAKAKAEAAAKAKASPKVAPITKAELEETLARQAKEAEAKTELESPEPNEVQEKPKRRKRRRRSSEESGSSDK